MKQELENAEISYLKQSHIGKVIAKGLAEVYLKRPQYPLDYFAKWLLNYSKSENTEYETVESLQKQSVLADEHNVKLVEAKNYHLNEVERQFTDKQIDLNFYEMLSNIEYHGELLLSILPNFVKTRKSFTGCYVAVLDHPEKEILPENDDEDAHLDKTKPKLLKYIGWSEGSELMQDQVLGLEEGVTGDIFKDKTQQQQQQQQDGKPPVEVVDYKYVADVIQEPRMKFFVIPRLGSYMALPLIFQSYLTVESFDNGVMTTSKYLIEREDQMKRRDDREAEVAEVIKEKEDAGADPEEIKQMQEQFNQEKRTDQLWVDLPKPTYISSKKEYVLCVDTLGQDKEISEDDREYLDTLVKLLARKWEDTELFILKHDVDLQVKYQDSVNAGYDQLLEGFNLEEEALIQERQAAIDQCKEGGEYEMTYQTECIRLEKVLQQLQDPDVIRWIYMQKEFRIIKFPMLIQIILYLLGYTKEEINIAGTNNLNWKYVRMNILDEQKAESEEEKFVNKVLAYEHRGPKEQPIPDYAKILRLTKRKEKFQQQEIDAYNIGLGRLFHWLDLTLKLRKMNIDIRGMQKDKLRQERLEIIAQNEQISNQKAQELEAQKASIPPEELENFDEEDWVRQFDEQNPLQDVPPEVIDDIDLDLEDIQQKK